MLKVNAVRTRTGDKGVSMMRFDVGDRGAISRRVNPDISIRSEVGIKLRDVVCNPRVLTGLYSREISTVSDSHDGDYGESHRFDAGLGWKIQESLLRILLLP
ncbi:MAG: hypothetical protein WC527_03865 [Candidatus Margulisiibacteriota bacterium]